MSRSWQDLSPVELLQKQRGITKEDLMAKFHREDWHGVADAAMDLREIDAELRVHRDTADPGACEAGMS